MSELNVKIADCQLGELLSRNRQREVYKALDQAGNPVIVKRLHLGHLGEWKDFELFEREADILQALSHPRVPRLLDYVSSQEEDGVVLTQVMEWIPGESLAARMQRGWRPAEAEVLEIARQGLRILAELNAYHPSLVHRDIKPGNLIWTDTQELFLIDFGAVWVQPASKGNTTVIGTYGYMAPEQFSGQSVPASDLYSLGATLLHLLAGKPPAEIPFRELRLDFRGHVQCSSGFQRFLEHLLEPELTHRFMQAEAALLALEELDCGQELSPSGRLSYVQEGQTASIRLEASGLLRICWQHAGLLAGVLGLLGSLWFIWPFYLMRLPHPLSDALIWAVLLWEYVVFVLLALGKSLHIIYTAARETVTLQLSPSELKIHFHHLNKSPLQIPRAAITRILDAPKGSRYRPWYRGVALSLEPAFMPDTRMEVLDLARGMARSDHQWLLTKLLLYHYQTRPAESGCITRP